MATSLHAAPARRLSIAKQDTPLVAPTIRYDVHAVAGATATHRTTDDAAAGIVSLATRSRAGTEISTRIHTAHEARVRAARPNHMAALAFLEAREGVK